MPLEHDSNNFNFPIIHTTDWEWRTANLNPACIFSKKNRPDVLQLQAGSIYSAVIPSICVASGTIFDTNP